MADDSKRHRVRSFVMGSLLGGLVVLAAPRAKRRRALTVPRGLAAFEGAPCYEAHPDGAVPDTGGPVADRPPPQPRA